MKILTDVNNVVIFAGNNDIEFNSDSVSVKAGTLEVAKLTNYNSTNTNIYDVEDSMIPANVVNKFKYVNGEFVKNSQAGVSPEEVNASLFEMTSILPSEVVSIDVEKRVNQELEYLKSLPNVETNFLTVSPDLLAGLNLLDTPDEELTEEELVQKNVAKSYKQKLTIRYRINAEVGDVADLVSDYGRQINLLTGMLVNLILEIKDGTAIPEEKLAQYLAFCRDYRQAVDSQQYFDRSDIEDPQIMVPKLLSREAMKATIVEEVKGA